GIAGSTVISGFGGFFLRGDIELHQCGVGSGFEPPVGPDINRVGLRRDVGMLLCHRCRRQKDKCNCELRLHECSRDTYTPVVSPIPRMMKTEHLAGGVTQLCGRGKGESRSFRQSARKDGVAREHPFYWILTSKGTVLEFTPAVCTKILACPANERSVAVIATTSWFGLTNLVCCGVPFHNTSASVPKFVPFTVMVNGTLFTGALPGESATIEGT